LKNLEQSVVVVVVVAVAAAVAVAVAVVVDLGVQALVGNSFQSQNNIRIN